MLRLTDTKLLKVNLDLKTKKNHIFKEFKLFYEL